MNRIVPLVISLFAVVASSHGEYRSGYYDAMDGKKKESLKEAAKACVAEHERLVYTDLPNYWAISDVYPDLYDGCLRWWDMYSDNVYLIFDGQTGKTSFSANKMQREHAVPKSWWKKDNDVEYTPAYSDMWNLYPSDGPANQAKNNYPLGPVQSASFDNGVTKVGSPASGFGGGCNNVFEPADEYKGDFARAFFYMATVYDELPWKYTYMFQTETWPTLQPWARDMLLEWSRQDPVSQKEIDRNDEVEKCQGNRNPFIDFPDLAEYVWGTLTADVFYLDANGVDEIEEEESPLYQIDNGYIRILRDSNCPMVITDMMGRILMKVDRLNAGDLLHLPASGILLIRSCATAAKIVASF